MQDLFAYHKTLPGVQNRYTNEKMDVGAIEIK